jgi:hypothetical protein
MIGTFLQRCWRTLRGKYAQGGGAEKSATHARMNNETDHDAVRMAINAFLREPLGYPANVDYDLVARLKAAAASADYMVAHMMNARNLVGRAELLEFALGECSVDGLILEFGVFRGESLRFMAKRTRQEVHGFDSFEGLPEDWTYFQKQGRFSLEGKIPDFRETNIRVYKGWFEETLPRFLAGHTGAARLIHIDCDIYSSTRTVLDLAAPRVVKGTVIVFDEYLNYPSWQAHEFRAFQEFVAANHLRYRYAGFASSHSSVAVVIE